MKTGSGLAHYEIIDLLGKGGMGEVYRARDTRLKREVALKILPTETAADPERLERFQREAETVAGLNHPNIVTLFSVEEDDEWRVKGQALALHALGRQDEYRARLAELIEGWGAEWPSEVAHVYAFAGNTDAAFAWLDKAVAKNEAGLTEGFLLPFYSSVHTDLRWAVFLERVGSSPEQLDTVEFEVALPK